MHFLVRSLQYFYIVWAIRLHIAFLREKKQVHCIQFISLCIFWSGQWSVDIVVKIILFHVNYARKFHTLWKSLMIILNKSFLPFRNLKKNLFESLFQCRCQFVQWLIQNNISLWPINVPVFSLLPLTRMVKWA